MTVLIAALATPLILLPLVKWWRVVQREHYIPASLIASHRRWLAADPRRNLPPAIAAAAGAVLALLPVADGVRIAGLVVAVIGALVFPVGLGFRGRTSKLGYTRRVYRIVGVTLAFMIVVAVVVALVGDVLAAAAVSVLSTTVAVEAALRLLAPVEARLARTFQDSAAEKMRKVGPKIVAITGSYGKTSTKEHVAALLASNYRVFASPGSWNNAAGLSRAINEQMPVTTEIFIAEMGTYGPGEIEKLCAWLPPTVAAITSIGPVHLERMKTLEGITKAKSEITATAETVVLNTDYEHLADLAEQLASTGKTVIRVGASDGTDVTLSGNDGRGTGHRLRIGEQTDQPVDFDDSVHAGNVAVAVGIALACGLDAESAIAALPTLRASANRASETVTPEGVAVIDDTFNSNPDGAAAALARLNELVTDGKKIVVTPGMIEMGPRQAEENSAFAAAIVGAGAELLIVGKVNRQALLEGARIGTSHLMKTRDEAREWLRSNLRAGDGVLWESDLPDHYP